MSAGRSVLVAGLALLLAAGCTSGHHARKAAEGRPSPRGTGTPDPCALLTRKEAEAAVHDHLTPPQPTTEVFGDTPEPDQRVCQFVADGVKSVGDVELVVFPDGDGARLLRKKAALESNPNFSSTVRYPGGLGPNAAQSGGLLFARKGGYTLGLSTYGASDAELATLARKAYRRL